MRTGNSVSSICQRHVVTVRPDDEVTVAARVMREKHVGFVVVTEHDASTRKERPLGVLTDRDIVVEVIAQNAAPQDVRVGDIMTRQPVIVSEGESIAAALRNMRRAGVRRLPVVDYRGHLVGVLSFDDVIAALSTELQDLAGSIETEQRIEGALRS